MKRDDIHVSDADLHALADGQLQEPRRTEVEAYLETHPEAARLVAEYRRLSHSLHALYDPVLDEDIPPKVSLPTSSRIGWQIPRTAVAAVFLLLGAVMGWTLNEQLASPQQEEFMVDLIRPAAFAHAVYTPEVRHPVDVSGDDQAHLVNWLSKRLKTPLHAPDLRAQGFELVGGRLLPSTGRMAAQFMYQDGTGDRITLYVRKGDWESRETAFRYAHEHGVGIFFWIDGPLGYALTGELSKDRLLKLASAVYRAISS